MAVCRKSQGDITEEINHKINVESPFVRIVNIDPSQASSLLSIPLLTMPTTVMSMRLSNLAFLGGEERVGSRQSVFYKNLSFIPNLISLTTDVDNY